METTPKKGIEFYGGYQVYSDSGVDLTLLRENLKKTPTQRWLENMAEIPFIESLRAAALAGRRTVPRPDNGTAMLPNFPEMLRLLDGHHVDYVLIGGLAMIAHGSAYLTKDLDVCYARTPENI